MEITVNKDEVLVELVKEKSGFASMTRARKVIKNGKVLVDGKVQTRPATLLNPGQKVIIHFNKQKTVSRSKAKFPFHILLENEEVIAFMKPTGLPVRSTSRKVKTVQSSLSFWIAAQDEEEELYIINKIDKRESGIIIAARSLKTRVALDKTGVSDKKYYALVEGEVNQEDGILKNKLKQNKIGMLFEGGDDSESDLAVLTYRKMKGNDYYTLLKVIPDTSVRNQERAQLAIAKYPIAGDSKYKAKTNPYKRICLHLFSLDFILPSTEEKITVKTPVPKNFLSTFRK